MLTDFVAFAGAAGQDTITIETALLWAKQPAGGCHAYLSQRMRAVRGFGRYLHALEPSAEVPPLDLLPARKHRPTPYIYTVQETAALMTAARSLRPRLREQGRLGSSSLRVFAATGRMRTPSRRGVRAA